jgi:hypothetical protein
MQLHKVSQGNNAQNLSLWDEAIRDAERKLKHTEIRKQRLQAAIENFRANRDAGHLWPGTQEKAERRGSPFPLKKVTRLRRFLAAWFLALFGEFFPAFFRMNENVIRIAEFHIPCVSDLAEAVHIVSFDAGYSVQGFVIDFGL